MVLTTCLKRVEWELREEIEGGREGEGGERGRERQWVNVGFSRDAVLTLHYSGGSVKLNNCMAIGASQALAWLAVPHLGAHPMAADEIHLRMNLG